MYVENIRVGWLPPCWDTVPLGYLEEMSLKLLNTENKRTSRLQVYLAANKKMFILWENPHSRWWPATVECETITFPSLNSDEGRTTSVTLTINHPVALGLVVQDPYNTEQWPMLKKIVTRKVEFWVPLHRYTRLPSASPSFILVCLKVSCLLFLPLEVSSTLRVS